MAIRSSAECASGAAVHYTPIEQLSMHLPAVDAAVCNIPQLLGMRSSPVSASGQNQERLRREAEEYAAWQAYVQQMQDTYTAYAIAAHQAMQQQMMQVAMQQQAMQQHAMAMQHQHQTMAMPQAAPQHAMQQQAWQQPCAPYAQQPQSMYGANAQAMFQMPAEWVLYYNQQGQPYYYNERTGESAWSLAPGTNFRQGGQAACGGCGCGGCGMPYGQQQPMWGQPGYGHPWG